MEDNQQYNTTTSSKLQRIVEGVLRLLGIDDLVSYVQVLRNVFFVMLLVTLAVIEIFNTHLAERLTRNIIRKKQEIKELKWEYMTLKSDINHKTKQSEIQKLVEPMGLKSLQEPPKKIELHTEK